MNDNEYLKQVLKSQDLPEDSEELKELQAHRKDVEELIRKRFGDSSPTIRYGGSKAKGTLNREAYDLDIICYFPHDDTGAGETLEDIYKNVHDALSKEYSVEKKTAALRLKSNKEKDRGRDFHIDVVPGRYTDDSKSDCFLHQASGEKERLKTNLEAHIKYVKDSGVLDAIRLLKLWKFRKSLQAKQFVYELLIIKLLENNKSLSLTKQLEHVWKEIRDSKGPITVQDPANPKGNDLSGLLSGSVWAELSATAAATLGAIQNTGWKAVYGEVDQVDKEGRVEVLKKAAAAVTAPTKPWRDDA